MTEIPDLEITLHPLGEISMGLDAFGVTLRERERAFRALASEPIFTQAEPSAEPAARLREDYRYVLLHGLFATYVFDAIEWKMSLFRATIRGQFEDGGSFWTEENPVYLGNQLHLNAKSGRHYFVQFPFLSEDDFQQEWHRYHDQRVRQIQSLQRGT